MSEKTKDDSCETIESTSRFLETNTFVPDWNSNFRDVAFETLTSSLVKGKENIAHIKREETELIKAYNEMRDYSKTFYQLFNIDYNLFQKTISEIILLCYKNLHTVGIWDSFNLYNKLRANKKFLEEDFTKIIKLLSEFNELKKVHCAIIIVNKKILVNYHRLNVARLVLSEYCFEVAYRAELKGPLFEERCRKLMRNKGLITLPENVVIHENMLPHDISIELWNKEKKESDFDVISCSNNKIIVIECKERSSKKTSKRIKKLKIKFFKKYVKEHYHKTKWVSQNIELFEKYLGKNLKEALAVDRKKTCYIFPLIVSNKPVDIEDQTTPHITFLELKEIDFEKDLPIEYSNKSSGDLEITIQGRKTHLPWFSVFPD